MTPDAVLKHTKPTDDFLVSAAAYNQFRFLHFSVKNLDTDDIIFSIKSPGGKIDWSKCEDQVDGNVIDYEFPSSFLDSKQIETKLTFAVGPKALKAFRMIERHYFRHKLLRSYDFNFGFCIPNSENTWEQTYQMPDLSASLKKEMIENPGEARSDSFYFIDDELILHNKASYSYT